MGIKLIFFFFFFRIRKELLTLYSAGHGKQHRCHQVVFCGGWGQVKVSYLVKWQLLLGSLRRCSLAHLWKVNISHAHIGCLVQFRQV